MKYSSEAEARDKQKNLVRTMQIKLLDGFAALTTENYKEAAVRFANVGLVEDPGLNKICTGKDVAFYVTLCALSALNRKELK